MKNVFLSVAILFGLLSATQAATVSKDITITVTASGGGLSPPAGAQAGGFSTLAANYDFTTTMPANWLGCQPWDGQKHLAYQATDTVNNNGIDNSGKIPCEISQVTDPQNGGLTVLALPWKSTYQKTNGYPFTQNQLFIGMSPDYESAAANNNTMVQAPNFPNGYYEIEFRSQPSPDITSAPFQYPGIYTAEWQIFSGGGANFHGYEGDLFERFSIAGTTWGATSTFHEWGGNLGAIEYYRAANYDPRTYHKWAMRRTSNGSTTAFCTYLDGIFQACATNVGDGTDTTRKWGIIIDQGMACDFNGTGNLACAAGGSWSQTMYIKSVRVWSCANWQTTMCNGAALATAP